MRKQKVRKKVVSGMTLCSGKRARYRQPQCNKAGNKLRGVLLNARGVCV